MTSSTVVHSNAFNFMSFLSASVDPRTGQYTIAIDLPELKSNALCGPAVPLKLVFNPLNTLDSGFGVGWNFNLSQFTPHDSILALSTGETFKVTGSGTTPRIQEKKLDSFHFFNDGNDVYRVVHKAGLIETLRVGGSGDKEVALPVQIHAPSGHKVDLAYVGFNGGQRLASISDDLGKLLQINRSDDHTQVEVLLHPEAGPSGTPLARFELRLNPKRQVAEIILPTEERASWRFDYQEVRGLNCIKEVKTPVGGREAIEYLDSGHPYPGNSGRVNLPRVTRHQLFPGFEQPPMEVCYEYTLENFIGNGTNINWESNGLDQLYKVARTYTYGSTAKHKVAGAVVRTVQRTFNSFHLLTEETTTQGDCVQRVLTTYHTIEGAFEQQPAYFQLPKTVEKRWELLSDVTQARSETLATTYDNFGNLLEERQHNGIRTAYEYYPVGGYVDDEGDVHCPADPQDFVRNLRSQTVYPAEGHEGQAPIHRTRYRYVELPPLEKSLDEGCLLMASEALLDVQGNVETEQHKTLFDYIDNPSSAFFHGRTLQQSELKNGNTTTTDFSYDKVDGAEGAETVLQTLETLTGFDHGEQDRNGKARHVQKIVTMQHSLLHGQVLLSRDDNDVVIRATYDALQRVTSETVAPKTEFEATRHYTYALTSLDGQQAMQQVIDVKGVQTRSFFDGLNRVILEDRQDVDSDPVGKVWRPIYSALHDALENLVEETEFDWLEAQSLPLTSSYEFDDWGEQVCVTGPDGVKMFEVIDPIGDKVVPIMRAWRQGSGNDPLRTGVEKTWLGKFEKPERIEHLDLSEQVISVHRYDYDGLGRTVRETDARNAVTEYCYDAYDRMTVTVLPDNAQIVRAYAEHSSADLPTKISVDGVVLGEQHFDGLDRMILSDTGGRTRHSMYEPGQTRPASVTTASGQEILYEYVLQLGLEPKRRRLPGSDSSYTYDRHNARLLSCQEGEQQLIREYFSNGELRSETRRESDQQYEMGYVYSFRGRLLRYTDVLGQTQSYDYDSAGRLTSTWLGTTLSQFTYDDLGQTEIIETRDKAQRLWLRVSLTYDVFGREILRKFDGAGWHQELQQEYNAVDALEHRCLSEGSEILRDENYEYDLRGRLTKYRCTGTQPPVDPYGKTIEQQTFRFDKLDNLTRVLTDFPNEGSDTYDRNDAYYFFENKDPVQLSKVTNTHADYPEEISLQYDADGNMTHDEWGRMLDYDALGRVITVSDAPGTRGGD